MSRVGHILEKCACCGKTSEQNVLLSTSSFGSCDLDFRNPSLARGTEFYKIHECPSCGYVNTSLENIIEGARDVLATEHYKNYANIHTNNKAAKRFIRYAILSEATQNEDAQIGAYLHAAWMCDDAGDTDAAVELRCKVADFMLEKYRRGALRSEDVLQLADVLRRGHRFDEALALAKVQDNISEKSLSAAFSFEIGRAEQRDAACYKFSDATRPEDPNY